MMKTFIFNLIIITYFIYNVYANDLWTKYEVGSNVAINSISNYGNHIWIGTANSLVKLERINGDFKRFTSNDGLPDNYISSVCCDKSGLVYAGVSGHLIVISDDSLKDISTELILPYTNRDYGDSVFFANPSDFPSISVDNNNNIYVVANYNFPIGHGRVFVGRVYNNTDNNWKYNYEKYFDINTTTAITCIAINNDNELSMSFNTFQPFGISAMAFDKNGGLWRSHPMDNYPPKELADYRWLEYFKNNISTNYDSTNSTLSSNVFSIVVDDNNTAWFGGKNLVSFNGMDWKVYSADKWSVTTKINTLSIDDEGYLWIGTQAHGLWRFDARNATLVESAHQTPAEFTLSAAYPNPFNAQTTISFTLTKPAKVNLSIYNLTGQKVRELAVGNYSAGSHTAVWDGKDEKGEMVSSGLYLARMESGGVSKVVRMALVK